MKRWIHASTNNEDLLSNIVDTLINDYFWGNGADEVYAELDGVDNITEADLREAMNNTARYAGFDSDELEHAFAQNRKQAHEIAVKLGL